MQTGDIKRPSRDIGLFGFLGVQTVSGYRLCCILFPLLVLSQISACGLTNCQ